MNETLFKNILYKIIALPCLDLALLKMHLVCYYNGVVIQPCSNCARLIKSNRYMFFPYKHHIDNASKCIMCS